MSYINFNLVTVSNFFQKSIGREHSHYIIIYFGRLVPCDGNLLYQIFLSEHAVTNSNAYLQKQNIDKRYSVFLKDLLLCKGIEKKALLLALILKLNRSSFIWK